MWMTVGNPLMTDSDPAPSSPLWPSIPVRNATQTPPGTAVSPAPPADQVSGTRPSSARSLPVAAEYSSTTAPPGRDSRAAEAYKFMPPGPVASSVRSMAAGRTVRARTAPALADHPRRPPDRAHPPRPRWTDLLPAHL